MSAAERELRLRHWIRVLVIVNIMVLMVILGMVLVEKQIIIVRGEGVFHSYPTTFSDTIRALNCLHPCTDNNLQSETGQVFAPPVTIKTTRIVFLIGRDDGTTVRIRAVVHDALTGVYPITNVPANVNSPIATSEWVAAADVALGGISVSFNFTNPPVLDGGKSYAVSVQMDSSGTIVGNGYEVYFDPDSTFTGNRYRYSGNGYTAESGDHGFEVWGDEVAASSGPGGSGGDGGLFQPLSDVAGSLASPLVGVPLGTLLIVGVAAWFLLRPKGKRR